MDLIQLISDYNGAFVGLYSVPKATREEFFKQIQESKDQNDFDENNILGVKRVYIDEEVVDIKFPH